jgi:hypothetical protein
MAAAKIASKTPDKQTPAQVAETAGKKLTSAEIAAQVKALQEQARTIRAQERALRDAAKAKSVKSLNEIDETQRDERAPWLYGYIIIRVSARERAGQSREEALSCVLDNLRLGVTEEMSLRATRKAENAATRAPEAETASTAETDA